MTDRYTDPKSVPLFAEMKKLAAILPSQTVSQIVGKTRPSLSKADQPPEVPPRGKSLISKACHPKPRPARHL